MNRQTPEQHNQKPQQGKPQAPQTPPQNVFHTPSSRLYNTSIFNSMANVVQLYHIQFKIKIQRLYKHLTHINIRRFNYDSI